MKTLSFRILTAIFLGLLVQDLAMPALGQATLSISVTSVDGGANIRFGRINSPSAYSKEIKIRVTSTENKQYQIFQRINQPLTSERGEALTRSPIMAGSLSGSNSTGTLYLQNLEPLSLSDQLIYTSNPDGLSDSARLVYHIDPQLLPTAGAYNGRIFYSVRAIGSNSQDETTMDISFETPDELKYEQKASGGRDQISLDSDRPKDIGFAQISFSGNLSTDLKIYQEILEIPRDELGKEIDLTAVLFMAEGASRGETEFLDFSEIPRARKLVYSVREPEDVLQLNFKLNSQRPDLKSEIYRGRIRYTCESGSSTQSFDFNLEINIKPIFKIEITYPPGGVSFANILPNSPPQIKEVLVTVKTNAQRPYLISQNMQSPLVNADGKEAAKEFFNLRTEFLDQAKGKLKYPEFTPVPVGDVPIYFSDERGSPATFKVLYQQKPYSGMEPGNYRTMMTYTLEEI